ncbi:hypothetical protein LUZ60_006346 [Juncus effusus]|nr:hypothetical protein LUZ60_006346 [Juncus effusus]
MASMDIDYSSAISTDGEVYPFKVNYSKIKDIGVGKSVKSPIFNAGDHEWCISLYPQGYDEEDRGECVSIYLDLLCECDEVSVMFDFCLLDKDGDNFSFISRADEPYIFGTRDNTSWGKNRMRKRTELEADYIDANGCFVVLCMIRVQSGSCEQVFRRNSVGISHDFGKIFEGGDMTNVTFEVEGESFAAHRVVLALRSPVFKAELFGSMAESGSKLKSIMIKDMQPDVFKSLLNFIYTDSLPKINDKKAEIIMAQHLLVAADRYAVEGLKLMCEDKLCDNVSLDTVTSSLSIADRHNCTRLKNACLEFIAVPNNLQQFALNKEYIDLLHGSPSLIAEIEAKIS